MRIPLFWACLGAALGLTAAPARAEQSFRVDHTTLAPGMGDQVVQQFDPGAPAGTGAQVQTALQGAINSVVPQLTATVDASLAALQLGNFLGANGDALTLASKANSVDYASNAALFSLTGALGVGVKGMSLGDASAFQPGTQRGRLPAEGLGGTTSLTLGLNLGFFPVPKLWFFDLKRLSVYLSYSSLSLDTLFSNVRMALSTYGVHGQYLLIEGGPLAPRGLVGWGGLRLVTGLNVAHQDVSWRSRLPRGSAATAVSLPNDTLTLTARWTGLVDLDLNVRTYAIPFEASTSLQLLYFLSLYGGVGFDLAFGSSALTAASDVPIELTVSDPSGASLNVLESTAVLGFDQHHGPTLASLRAFAGLQLQAGVVGAFAQIAADTTSSTAVQAGARLFW